MAALVAGAKANNQGVALHDGVSYRLGEFENYATHGDSFPARPISASDIAKVATESQGKAEAQIKVRFTGEQARSIRMQAIADGHSDHVDFYKQPPGKPRLSKLEVQQQQLERTLWAKDVDPVDVKFTFRNYVGASQNKPFDLDKLPRMEGYLSATESTLQVDVQDIKDVNKFMEDLKARGGQLAGWEVRYNAESTPAGKARLLKAQKELHRARKLIFRGRAAMVVGGVAMAGAATHGAMKVKEMISEPVAVVDFEDASSVGTPAAAAAEESAAELR